MRLRPSIVLLLLVAPIGACASGSASTAGVAPGAALDPRCTALADSVRASTSMGALPLVTPTGRPVLPRPPSDVREGVPLQTTFLVRPDGRADTASVTVTGTMDSQYRREMVYALGRTTFRPTFVGGCRSWGRGEFQMRMESRIEVRRVPPDA